MISEPPNQPALFKAVSPWFVLFTVGACLTMAASLVPQRGELLKRLMEDGQHARALELAGEQDLNLPPASEAPAVEIRAAISVESPLDKLKRELAVQKGGKDNFDQSVGQVGDAKACLFLIRQVESNLAPDQLEKVYLATARSALAQENPGLAAEVFAEAASKGLRSESLLAEEVQAYRWSGQPQKALAAIDNWIQSGATLSSSMRDAEISVLREVNNPQRALGLILEKLTAQKESAGYEEATMLLASEVAANAGQMERILPIIHDYLAALPAGRATLDELSSKKIVPDESWFKFARLTAQHFEWGDKPEDAYALYEKLAVLGDANALDRILDLNGGLNRDGEVLEVLRRVVPVKARPELDLKLAKMLADAGEYTAADEAYGKWIATHPKDVKAILERAAIADDESRYEDALAHYRQALVIEPKNIEIQKEIADIQISRREFREAFEFYDHFPEAKHDHFTLENYALIAEALAEYPAYNRALVLRQHRLKNPSAQDFLQLARSFELIGNRDEVIATYQSGLKKIPGSRILKIELANTFRLEDRYDEAGALLAQPEMKADMHAMTLFIEVCALKEDYVGALAFLGRGIEKKFAFGPDTRLDLGHIYFNNGYLAEADALYSSVPDEPALWPLLATARYKTGNFASAELYQRKYLASLKVPSASAWMMLGDILKAEGRQTEAQDAYAKSLVQLEEKMTSGGEDVEDDQTPDSEEEGQPVATPPTTTPKSAASN